MEREQVQSFQVFQVQEPVYIGERKDLGFFNVKVRGADQTDLSGWRELPLELRDIIDFRCGYSSGEPHSLKQTANQMERSITQIVRLQQRAHQVLAYMNGNTDVKIPQKYKKWIDYAQKTAPFMSFEEYKDLKRQTQIAGNKQTQEKDQFNEELLIHWQQLPDRLRILIGFQRGYLDGVFHTNKEVSQQIGVSKSRVSQLQRMAFNTLKYMNGDKDVTIPKKYGKWIDAQTETSFISFEAYQNKRNKFKKVRSSLMPSQKRKGLISGTDCHKDVPEVFVNHTDTLGMYLHDIRQIPPLTKEQEIELTERMTEGRTFKEGRRGLDTVVFTDSAKEAYDALIRSNLRLVISWAKKRRGLGVSFLELINSGNIGLMRGIVLFKPEMGNKLSTYCTPWIKQAIYREISNKGRTIRHPVYYGDWVTRVRRERSKLEQLLKREPTDKETAAHLGMPTAKFKNKIELLTDIVSLNDPIGDDDNTERGDFIVDSSQDVEDETDKRLNRKLVNLYLSKLTFRERSVIKMRFGIDDKDSTIGRIAEKWRVTPKEVRQIEQDAFVKMREANLSDVRGEAS